MWIELVACSRILHDDKGENYNTSLSNVILLAKLAASILIDFVIQVWNISDRIIIFLLRLIMILKKNVAYFLCMPFALYRVTMRWFTYNNMNEHKYVLFFFLAVWMGNYFWINIWSSFLVNQHHDDLYLPQCGSYANFMTQTSYHGTDYGIRLIQLANVRSSHSKIEVSFRKSYCSSRTKILFG